MLEVLCTCFYSRTVGVSSCPRVHVGIDFPSAPEVHITMEMGGFLPVGIAEVPAICPDAEELNGLPINRVGPRILHLVREAFFLCSIIFVPDTLRTA